jgi:hypothetical protein
MTSRSPSEARSLFPEARGLRGGVSERTLFQLWIRTDPRLVRGKRRR